MNAVLGGVAFVGALALQHPSQAADLLVPSEFPSVQAAHDAAVAGDRIVLEPGTYAASDWQLSKSVTITSASGPIATIVTAETKGAAIRAFAVSKVSASTPVRIERISFVGCAQNLVNSAALDLDRCRFLRNGGPGTFGGAVLAQGGAVLRLSRCSFEDCRADGGGAVAVVADSLAASDCIFLRNSAIWDGGPSEGGAVHMVGAAGEFNSCTFVGNAASIGGAICRWWNNPVVAVSTSWFGENSSDWNCCVQCDGCATGVPAGLETDCNGNGVPDAVELLIEPASDANQDGTIDACRCACDLVQDGLVNGSDMAIVLNFWGTDGAQFAGVDINGDGTVDGVDLAAVLGAWGPCPQ